MKFILNLNYFELLLFIIQSLYNQYISYVVFVQWFFQLSIVEYFQIAIAFRNWQTFTEFESRKLDNKSQMHKLKPQMHNGKQER